MNQMRDPLGLQSRKTTFIPYFERYVLYFLDKQTEEERRERSQEREG